MAKGASGTYHVFDIPTPDSLDLKKAARAVGEKSVELLRVAEINAVTGYGRLRRGPPPGPLTPR